MDLGRLDAAMARLLERVRHRRAEPHIYAALVHACRYGGLLDESLAAHRHAQRLDPTVSTSVHHTLYMMGDYVGALALAKAGHASDPMQSRFLAALGRDEEALAAAREEDERFASVPTLRAFVSSLRAILEGRHVEGIAESNRIETFGFNDGEGLFYLAGTCVRLEQPQRAWDLLSRAIDAGFLCRRGFETDVFLEPLRAMAEWQPLLEKLDVKRRRVMNEFVRGGGRALLA